MTEDSHPPAAAGAASTTKKHHKSHKKQPARPAAPKTPPPMDPKDAQGIFQALHAEADKLLTSGHYEESLDRFNRALEINPGNCDCMVSRSKVFMMMGDPVAALHDVDDVIRRLEAGDGSTGQQQQGGEGQEGSGPSFPPGIPLSTKHPAYIRALLQKAEALYARGDFEESLVLYHRGRRMRPEMESFHTGVIKATESIRAAVAMLDVASLREKREVEKAKVAGTLAQKSGGNGTTATGGPVAPAGGATAGRRSVLKKPTTATVNPSKPPSAQPRNPSQPQKSVIHPSGAPSKAGTPPAVPAQPTTTNIVPLPAIQQQSQSQQQQQQQPSKQTQERNLLEDLYEDKSFLEELASDERFMIHAGFGEVGPLVREALGYLQGRVEFWRQRNPFGVSAAAVNSSLDASNGGGGGGKVVSHGGMVGVDRGGAQ
ncbi:Tetratricopeptide repeat protein 25 [Blyttiomyces sp. JEL0837]|nr:Tetratricopeptide repeat protein 25 [Blyttiomyces sp. JEL0837]